MGEMADDIIDGNCCALCGQYFVKKTSPVFMYTHGFPVACYDCYEENCGYEVQDKKATTL